MDVETLENLFNEHGVILDEKLAGECMTFFFSFNFRQKLKIYFQARPYAGFMVYQQKIYCGKSNPSTSLRLGHVLSSDPSRWTRLARRKDYCSKT